MIVVLFCCRLELWRDTHAEYLTHGLRHLSPSFHVLDAK
jgi:protein farnesyltransferase subunit beta